MAAIVFVFHVPLTARADGSAVGQSQHTERFFAALVNFPDLRESA
jgi:hypothetical protein